MTSYLMRRSGSAIGSSPVANISVVCESSWTERMTDPSRLSQPATISSTFPVSTRGGPTLTVATIGPIWIRSPSLSGLSLFLRSRPLTIVPLVLPRSCRTMPDPLAFDRRVQLADHGRARRKWQHPSRPIKNREPRTATLRPLDPPTWTLSRAHQGQEWPRD